MRNLAGLTATDARRLALKAIDDNGAITESDMPEVMRAKYELLGRDSPLSFEYETAQFGEIGGMSRLRQWLEVRKSFLRRRTRRSIWTRRAGMLLLGRAGLRQEPRRQSRRRHLRRARCCAWILACSTTSITARPSATCARRSIPPR